MKYFPLFLDIKDKPCLVAGGGKVATRKVRALLKAEAKICVVSHEITEMLQKLVAAGEIEWRKGPIVVDRLNVSQYLLVIAATSDDSVNVTLAKTAKEAGVHCNVASNSELGDVVLPSIIDRSPMIIALNSGGKSPTVTRYLKRQLEAFIPLQFGRLAEWAEQWRLPVKHRVKSEVKRRRLWDRILSGLTGEHLMADDARQADLLIQKRLDAAESGEQRGEVFLVGAGPGDPELLTLKALRLIQQADVVLYDRLVSESILSLLPESCERIYVGKRQADHAVPQGDINQTLVDLAKAGRNVLRLKGGDPFIFGRGGEEIELLAENQVAFQVVPGITAASGCASYSGIPLTHRDHSQSVRFVTGHLKNNQVNLPWPELAQEAQTLVFYMGLTGLRAICESLIAHGRAESTPAAVVERGTTPQQRVIVGDLLTLADKVAKETVKAPTLLIIGEVVQLHSSLSWYKPGT